MSDSVLGDLKRLVEGSKRIVVVQADNPDADSIGSALALEAILNELGKDIYLYGAVDIPDYLKYLEGWSRVNPQMPSQFDASIIVDASTKSLFEKDVSALNLLSTKPCVVLDHHKQTASDLDFATIINEPGNSSTCELIFKLSKEFDWKLPADALPYILTGILADTQGLANQLASSGTYRIVAELIDMGVDRPALEEKRRAYSKMTETIFRYKAKLIERTELFSDSRIAIVSVPQEEISTYSPLYNPGPLIQTDMLQIEKVQLGIVFKVYDDGHLTAMIRSNPSAGIADRLALHFGGGGHAFASGFKLSDGRAFNEVKVECVAEATKLLDGQSAGTPNETV